jgi:pyridoxal phosphate enzyme (YggS family)
MLPVAEPPLTSALIRTRFEALSTRLRDAAFGAGQDPDRIRIVAVTKGFDLRVLAAARDAGLTRFGESRVQEALPKVAAAPEAEWHLIGRLQANKVRPAVRAFSMIHSVDSLELLGRIERIAVEEGVAPELCLQVNLAGEASKGGFDGHWFADQVARRGALAQAITGLRSTRVVGLMAIAPLGQAPGDSRASFAAVRGLRDQLAGTIGLPLLELSMGMTADAVEAVAEGATLVRVGTAIFGPRSA